MPIKSRGFSRYTIELWNKSEIDHVREEDGICLVIKTDDQKNHVRLDSNMFDADCFEPLDSAGRSNRRCYVCGNSGDNLERYQYTGFILHEGCRKEFKDRVLQFIEDSNEDIVVKSL